MITTFDPDGLDAAACAGLPVETYHPEVGDPSPAALARCDRCPPRLACLALALCAEPADARHGWYGGLGPVDRDALAARLGLTAPPRAADRSAVAARLRAAGRTLDEIAAELGCCRRTVQRYLNGAA